MRYSLEYIPDELSIQILGYLAFKDLQQCRAVSYTMREKVDRIFYHLFDCIYLDDHNLNYFRTSRRASLSKTLIRKSSNHLQSNFTRMKICHIPDFIESLRKLELNPSSIRSSYFDNIVELEFTQPIGKKYFHRFLELTSSLKVLKLSSAVLGGSENLFGLRSNKSSGTGKLNSILNSWPKLKEVLIKPLMKPSYLPRSLMNILELHLKLDYISPSSPNFSPFVLVDNLNNIRQLPTFFLRRYSVLIEESKDSEQFYFTISALLNTIPVRSYECLKVLSFKAPRCRQENCGNFENPLRRKEKLVKSMTKFSEMKLKELEFKTEFKYKHDMPPELGGLISSQKYLEVLNLTGIA